MSKYGVNSGLYFPVFGLNTEIYGINLHIQFEYRKIRTRNNSVFGHFSRGEWAYRIIRFNPVSKNMLKPPDQLTWKSCSMLMQFCSVFIVDVDPDFTLIGGLFGPEAVD